MSRLSDAIERIRSSSISLPSSAEDRKKLLLAAVLFIFFAVLAFVCVANFIWLNRLTVDSVSSSMPEDFSEQDETTQKADELSRKISAYLKYRDDGMRMIELAESTGVPPIAGLQTAGAQGELSVPEYTPSIVIKALVVMGKNAVATLDIDGEPAGQVYTKGMTFGGNKGKITEINSKGVSWIWSGKRHRTNL